jgi:Type I phosphodiesterase / nucleotide pyrophosphatase
LRSERRLAARRVPVLRFAETANFVTGHRVAAAAGLVALVAGATGVAATANANGPHPARVQHVLLLSVDGMHQSDLAWYVTNHPQSALAKLVRSGVSYTRAQTPVPSDSFPGLLAQVTGGNPSSTGVYYDDTWNSSVFPAGTTDCTTATPGAEVTYFEQLDKNPASLDAGQGLAGLPGSILSMTSHPTSLIDPTQLPVDPASCQPIYPHSYLQVNTIFEVARAAGLRTAWTDKHPAYEIVNGPSGTGVQDLFTPEINSDAPTVGSPIDWTKDNALTQQYDGYKVQSVINEINGFDHTGTTAVGTPAIFGMNFQTVSTAEKLPTSGGQPGGYLADGVTPGPVLSTALDFINTEVASMQAAIHAQGLDGSTVIVLSAKHGQSPMEPFALTRINDSTIMSALDDAWNAAKGATTGLVAFSVNDDGMQIWLKDHSDEAAAFARNFLLARNGTGNDINGNPKAFTASGLSAVYAGQDAADFYGVQRGDARVPDVVGIAQHGVVYTGGTGKIAEHGGADPQDRNVPLVVSGASIDHHQNSAAPVETTQIAPTILKLLGLNPNYLQAVQIEHTRTLDLG